MSKRFYMLCMVSYFFFPFQCCGQYNSNEIYLDHFSKTDGQNIELLVRNFDEQIIFYYCDSINIKDAYYNFFQSISKSNSAEDFFNKNVIYHTKDDLLKSISETTLRKIWNYQVDPHGKVIIDGINLQGEYIDFLLSKKHELSFLDEYTNSIMQAGAIGPTNLVLLLSEQSQLNICDIDVRFIIAVHYISFTNEIVYFNGNLNDMK